MALFATKSTVQSSMRESLSKTEGTRVMGAAPAFVGAASLPSLAASSGSFCRGLFELLRPRARARMRTHRGAHATAHACASTRVCGRTPRFALDARHFRETVFSSSFRVPCVNVQTSC
mmetsp:Transcript_11467/g.24565  ORF Transcript_11467/g.24565 Transcript_11467/m.24565 type:complete len:118 (+) Transcript_11467:183-536(+)|eukprot:4583605-Pleurochrysis_carterae.AAC.1